jgi:hypothetical protein
MVDWVDVIRPANSGVHLNNGGVVHRVAGKRAIWLKIFGTRTLSSIAGSVANKPGARYSMLVDWPNSITTGGCSDQIQPV